MAILIDETDRRLVPTWNFFKDSTLELHPISNIAIEKNNIQEFVQEWKIAPNLANAGDLLTAAIINNREDVQEVYDAARFIVNTECFIPAPLLKKAKDIIGEQPILNVDCVLPPHKKLYQKIAELKRLLVLYPKDAILHIEIARCYLALGLIDKADIHVRCAVSLDSNNRYIVRCAARFYVHQQKPELALQVVRGSKLITYDPWLLAAEISLCQLNNKTSRHIKKGFQLIESGDFGTFDLTELRSAIGTEEFLNGAFSKSRKLFNASLLQPNGNSLAQARWISNRGLELSFEESDLSQGLFVEAKSYKAVLDKDYKLAVNLAQQWIDVEPYSTRTILYAYNIAVNYLRDNPKSLKILSNAYETHKSNPVILNDYAYSMALTGNVKQASNIIKHAKSNNLNESDVIDICITATKGLIAFRSGDATTGSMFYDNAITRSLRHPEKPALNYSALLNYCRELLIYDNSSETREVVFGIIDKIPTIENNIELKNLHNDVVDLIEKGQQFK